MSNGSNGSMKGESIICFSKDWNDDPTSVNHVMKMLARDNRVLWLNSISSRTPSLNLDDMRKMFHKAKTVGRSTQRLTSNIAVHTPLVLPFPHSRVAVTVNRQILRATLGRQRRKLGMQDYQMWTFVPTSVEYAGHLDEQLLVYYITDDWSQFSFLKRDEILAMEAELARRADIVFATSRTLLEKKRHYNVETHLASHGVDQAHFARALDPATKVPADIASLKGPIIGFFGLIQDWIDIDLFAYLADKRPSWNIVVIGSAKIDVSRLAKYPNIHLIGRRPYSELPAYCKAFDVATCPFVINDLTLAVNPIKLREYLSAGLPVVSTDLPEMALYPDSCKIARSPEQFLAACEASLSEGSPERRRQRSDAMRAESWEARVAEIGANVMRVKARKLGYPVAEAPKLRLAG